MRAADLLVYTAFSIRRKASSVKGGISSLFLDRGSSTHFLGRHTLGSPGRGHGASTVAPRRGAWDLIDGELCATTVMHCAQLQRLHQSLCRRRTATLRWIATARGGFIQAIRRNGDVPKQPHSDQYATTRGSGGKISYIFPPGGFRFLSPCRKEQRDSNELLGNVLISIMSGSVIRRGTPPVPPGQLPQRGSLCAP